MAEIVCDCPRCGAKQVTFDIYGDSIIDEEYGWAGVFEAFCVCRRCRRGTIFVLAQREREVFDRRERSISKLAGSVHQHFSIRRYVSVADQSTISPPEHLPDNIRAVFDEAARCYSAKCWNASGTMFRLTIDLATSPLLPVEERDGLNSRTRRDLGLRLPWLFDNRLLPDDLRDLSACIREDGNDAAHRGTLTQAESEDLLDFSVTLLERIFTTPARVRLAAERRVARRANPGAAQ